MTSAAATLSASPAKIGRVLSPGGVEAWHVQSDLVPLVALAFTFEGGSAKDPPGKAGVAQMLARLLDEGAGAYSSDAFQERLAARAIELSFNAGPDAVGGSLKTLVRHADEAFALLRLALGLAALRRGRDRARARPDHRRAALPAERSRRHGLAPLLRRGVSGPPLRPSDERHHRERRRDHPAGHPRPARASDRRRAREDRRRRRDRSRAPRRHARRRLRRAARMPRRRRRCRRPRSPAAARATSSTSTCRNR